MLLLLCLLLSGCRKGINLAADADSGVAESDIFEADTVGSGTAGADSVGSGTTGEETAETDITKTGAEASDISDDNKNTSGKNGNEIYDWVEYLNDDGSYTKGSDLKKENDTNVKNGEEQAMTKADLKSLPTVSEEDLLYYQNQTAGCYFYQRLTPEDQLIYCEMLSILSKHQEGVKLSTIDVDKVNRVYDSLWKDHAELFFVDGCSYTSFYLKDELKALAFSGAYNLETFEIEKYQQNIDRYVEKVLAQYNEEYPGGSDDYGKIKFWYEYLINHTEYDINSPNNQNILSVMENGRSVCQGYARTTQYVLSKMGIKTLLVVGTGRNNESHAWNEVFADGNWYHLDATWGDASYEINGDMTMIDSLPPVNYDYLLVNDAEIMKTHAIRDKDELPAANALTDYYYVREGAYFTEINENQIKAVFDYARARGMTYVTLKMDNAQTYEKMENYLLVEQKIFDFLGEQGTASYSVNREQNYMVFWI